MEFIDQKKQMSAQALEDRKLRFDQHIYILKKRRYDVESSGKIL